MPPIQKTAGLEQYTIFMLASGVQRESWKFGSPPCRFDMLI
jgi:hypothetical protein